MAARGLLVASIVLFCFVGTCFGEILFSTLPKTLLVTGPKKDEVLKAGESNITVTWSLNQTFPSGTDSTYKTIKVKLCYAPVSQKDRGWRKTVDNLKKDKTCQFLVAAKPYTNANTTVVWTIETRIPQATYFVRAYAFNSVGHEVGYGQTTNAFKTDNLFAVQAITGRHVSLDIASVCFSAFSVVSLAGFFYMEKRKAKIAQQK